jgi:hypothetical protein
MKSSYNFCLMKKINLFSAFLLVLFIMGCNISQAQKPVNWTADQLMEPAALAQTLKINKKVPIIISVGPGALIPNSIDIGMASEEKKLDKFKEEISRLPKDTSIVIYCGCCPFERCPNVRPAIDVLKKMKFTNYHLLNLPTNIKTDWISKGYPTVE